MNVLTLATVDGLDPRDMVAIIHRLTNKGSEFHLEVKAVLEGNGSSSTPIAVWHCDGALVGWSCSHVWRERQTLEQYVDERHRKSGKGTALSAVLTASGTIDVTKPLAVFSPVTALIARKLGALMVEEYDLVNDEWTKI